MISSVLGKTSLCMLVCLNLSACLKVTCGLHNVSRPMWYVLSEIPKMKELISVFVSTSNLKVSGVAAEGYFSDWRCLIEQNATTVKFYIFWFVCLFPGKHSYYTYKNTDSYTNMKWVESMCIQFPISIRSGYLA